MKLRLCTSLFLASLLVAQPTIAQELVVSAAASLTNAFTELKALFEAKHPKVSVVTNFAASNALLKQMQEGAPVDVFASADQETMDKAVLAKLVDPHSRTNFVANTLVLIVPKHHNKPQSLRDLTTFSQIALGDPKSVPAGRYAKQCLERASLWTELAPKYIYGGNVRQVLDYVARGEVEAGFVYGTDAKKKADQVEVALILTEHNPILYPIALATTGKNPNEAQAFINFVLSEEGRAILAKHGFAKP